MGSQRFSCFLKIIKIISKYLIQTHIKITELNTFVDGLIIGDLDLSTYVDGQSRYKKCTCYIKVAKPPIYKKKEKKDLTHWVSLLFELWDTVEY